MLRPDAMWRSIAQVRLIADRELPQVQVSSGMRAGTKLFFRVLSMMDIFHAAVAPMSACYQILKPNSPRHVSDQAGRDTPDSAAKLERLIPATVSRDVRNA